MYFLMDDSILSILVLVALSLYNFSGYYSLVMALMSYAFKDCFLNDIMKKENSKKRFYLCNCYK
jgi:hypothetical protein